MMYKIKTLYLFKTFTNFHDLQYLIIFYRLAQAKKLHWALGSVLCPAALAQAQNWRLKFAPFFLTVLRTQGSPCPAHIGAGGGPKNNCFYKFTLILQNKYL